jgi:hypothetical protein
MLLSANEKEFNNVETMASAIEDLLYMGIIKFNSAPDQEGNAIFSPQFSVIVSNIMSEKKVGKHNDDHNDDHTDTEIMKLMYYSLLIYINEYLKLPKSLTIAFGNDLENYQEKMQCSRLISKYVTILRSIFLEQRKEKKK